MYNIFKSVMCAILGMSISVACNANAQTISLYTYHTHVPFITAKGEGLSYDLANFLTTASQGRYTFKVVASSRPRINKLIEGNSLGIVPWVNPIWFKDKEEVKYTWGQTVLMKDANAILSSTRLSVDYKGPESLKGMIFGGIDGHVYGGIDDYIKNGGDLRRVNSSNHMQNMDKIINGDVDIMLMPLSGALYSISHEKMEEKLFISPTPHSEYDRRFMIIGNNVALRDHIDKAMLRFVEEWNAIVQKYR